MLLIGRDDPIPDAVVVIPAEPTNRFGGDFANIRLAPPLGPQERVQPFVPRAPVPIIPSWVTPAPKPTRTRLWTDSEGRQWQITDAIRVATEDGSPKHRRVWLGDEGAHVRAFIPYGWQGEVMLKRFLGAETHAFDDKSLAMQFNAIGAVELHTFDVHAPPRRAGDVR